MAIVSSFPNTKTGHKQRDPERLAEPGINYLLADSEELTRFMLATGYDPDSLRLGFGSRELAVAVMDYFAANEAALLAMCANANLDVKEFMSCWRQLNHAV